MWCATWEYPKSFRWEAELFHEISSPGHKGRTNVSAASDECKNGGYGGVNKRIYYAV